MYLLFAITVASLIFVYGKNDLQLLANHSFYNNGFDWFFYLTTKVVELFSMFIFLYIIIFRSMKLGAIGVLIYGTTALITKSLKHYIFWQSMRPVFTMKEELRLLPDSFELYEAVQYSFPSGHTTASFTLFCFITIITPQKKWGYLFGFIAILVGYSRIYLSQHYFQDILVGATIGTIFTFILYPIFSKISLFSWENKSFINVLKK